MLRKMATPKPLGNGMYAISGIELKRCLQTNTRLRKICSNYAVVNSRVNKEYQKGKR